MIQSAGCASAPLAAAEAQGAVLASALGCSDPANAAACLRALPAEQLAAAGSLALFGSIVGGQLLPAAPLAAVVAAEQQRVPVLVGSVRDEMRGFAALEYPLDPAGYPAALTKHFPNVPSAEIIERYPLSAYPEAFLALSATLSDRGSSLTGSLGGCVSSALAGAFSRSTPTFSHELDDPGFPLGGGRHPDPGAAGRLALVRRALPVRHHRSRPERSRKTDAAS